MEELVVHNEAYSRVFSNGLIFRTIEQNLDSTDLKNLRQTCHLLREAVDEETDFFKKVVVVPGQKLVGIETNQLETKLKPKQLRVGIQNHDTEEVKDVVSSFFDFSQTEAIETVVESKFHKWQDMHSDILTSAMLQATSLKSLSLSFAEWISICEDVPFNSLQTVLASVEQLHIHGPDTTWERQGKTSPFRGLKLPNLREFIIERTATMKDTLVHLFQLAYENRAKITNFEMPDLVPWNDDEAVEVFPCLEDLHLKTYMLAYKSVGLKFLQVHAAQLSSATLLFGIAIPERMQQYWNIFRGLEQPIKMKRLSVKSPRFPFQEGDMDFVRNMTSLEELAIKCGPVASDNSLTFQDVFAVLPNSIKKLTICPPTPNEVSVLSAHHFAACSQLKYLMLEQCYGAVNDDVLQIIFSTMRGLEELHLTGLTACGHSGFSGMTEDGEAVEGKVAITNLQSLRHLSLNSRITDNIIRDSFKFRKLKTLNLKKNPSITAEGFRFLVTQNPSLEILQTDNTPEATRARQNLLYKFQWLQQY